jgi:two-component system nitrate/nitrite response regulator NarL
MRGRGLSDHARASAFDYRAPLASPGRLSLAVLMEAAVSAPSRMRILVADDHQMFREGLRAILDTEPDCEVVGEAPDGRDAVRLTRALNPDILLLDLTMPNMPGLDVLRELSAASSATRVVLLTAAIDKADMVKALQLGARGLILKESATAVLLKAIRAVAAGEYWIWPETVSDILHALRTSAPGGHTGTRENFGLTSRELEIVGAVMAAYGNREIATRLGISEKTVKHHLTNIFDKLGVSNRLELALFVVHHNIQVPDFS